MFFKLKKAVPVIVEECERSIALQGHRVDYKLVRRRGRRGVGLKVWVRHDRRRFAIHTGVGRGRNDR